MSGAVAARVEDERWVPPAETGGRSLVTSLGIIEGEVLLYLDVHGATPVRRLIRELEWPSPLVTMAVGALIREGLVRASQHELEVIVAPRRPPAGGGLSLVLEPVPEVWGGSP